MNPKNVILLLIDNLRFDSFDNANVANFFFPNLLFLKKNGFMGKIISNSHATKFVMPSLFTQTYPLDYGGYNQVLKKRPKSFVELLNKENYFSSMLQGDDNDGPENLCDRGFDHVEALYDRRLLLQNYIEEVVIHELKNITTSKQKVVLRKFRGVLKHLACSKNRVTRKELPKELQKIPKKLQNNLIKEIELIDSYPESIIYKLNNIEPYFYYLALGEKNIPELTLFFRRKLLGILSCIEKFFIKSKIFPFKFLTFRKTPYADEILKSTEDIIKKKKFFIYAHLMDLHDRRVANRISRAIRKILFFPHWLFISKNISFKRFLYDMSLSFIDKHIGKLIMNLKRIDKLKITKIIVTADHGTDINEKEMRRQNEIFGFRTHFESIEVPLIYFNSCKKFKNQGLFDSMSVSATILDDLEIKPHKSFKGISLFATGSKEIISENADRGNCDLQNKNLYFTVTCQRYKGMFYIKKDKMIIDRLYNLIEDPLELKNIVNNSRLSKVLKNKLNYLFRKRADILNKRNISKNKIFLNNKVFLLK